MGVASQVNRRLVRHPQVPFQVAANQVSPALVLAANRVNLVLAVRLLVRSLRLVARPLVARL